MCNSSVACLVFDPEGSKVLDPFVIFLNVSANWLATPGELENFWWYAQIGSYMGYKCVSQNFYLGLESKVMSNYSNFDQKCHAHFYRDQKTMALFSGSKGDIKILRHAFVHLIMPYLCILSNLIYLAWFCQSIQIYEKKIQSLDRQGSNMVDHRIL